MVSRAKRPYDELQRIPGIGPSLARDLRDLGVQKIEDLTRRDPAEMHRALESLRGTRQDPCVLYAFRCAVYFASETRHDPEKLKWWNWTDARM